LADKLLVLAVFCTLLAQDRLPVWFVVLALSREMAITSLRALAAGEGIIIAAGSGGKWKTAFQLTGLILILWRSPWLPVLGDVPIPIRFEHAGVAILMLSLLLSLTSGGRYMMAFLRSLAEGPADELIPADAQVGDGG
jgi:CDP-diacylglycerol--glycerol-3-phosphate 3-phosphatidyltransferase